jgi:hypothetical protein
MPSAPGLPAWAKDHSFTPNLPIKVVVFIKVIKDNKCLGYTITLNILSFFCPVFPVLA